MSLPMTTRPVGPGPGESKLAASIRHVLRHNGASSHEMDDLFQQVMLEVEKSATLPPSEPERTRYIHGIARNVAKRRTGELAGNLETEAFDIEELAGDQVDEASAHGVREVARKLYDAAAEVDPQGLDWLVRSRVEGEAETTIARSDGVPVDRVRKRVSRLTRRMRVVAVALGVIAALVLFFFFAKRWRLRASTGEIQPDIAWTDEPRGPTPKEEANLLRDNALRECDGARWAACLRDLDAARGVDPDGDLAPEVVRARRAADEHLRPPQAPIDRKPRIKP
jgi:DNA-directed RNA polymerase specialized sigma24 family protein